MTVCFLSHFQDIYHTNYQCLTIVRIEIHKVIWSYPGEEMYMYVPHTNDKISKDAQYIGFYIGKFSTQYLQGKAVL